MASAGRILIMPKGTYDENVTYEALDVVGYEGTSWMAKKTVKGIAPSDANSEYWFNMFGADLGQMKNDIEALKNVIKVHNANYSGPITAGASVTLGTIEAQEILSVSVIQGQSTMAYDYGCRAYVFDGTIKLMPSLTDTSSHYVVKILYR